MIEQKLLDRLRELQIGVANGIVDVPSPDFAHYRQQVGFHQGLGQAIEELEVLMRDDSE